MHFHMKTRGRGGRSHQVSVVGRQLCDGRSSVTAAESAVQIVPGSLLGNIVIQQCLAHLETLVTHKTGRSRRALAWERTWMLPRRFQVPEEPLVPLPPLLTLQQNLRVPC